MRLHGGTKASLVACLLLHVVFGTPEFGDLEEGIVHLSEDTGAGRVLPLSGLLNIRSTSTRVVTHFGGAVPAGLSHSEAKRLPDVGPAVASVVLLQDRSGGGESALPDNAHLVKAAALLKKSARQISTLKLANSTSSMKKTEAKFKEEAAQRTAAKKKATQDLLVEGKKDAKKFKKAIAKGLRTDMFPKKKKKTKKASTLEKFATAKKLLKATRKMRIASLHDAASTGRKKGLKDYELLARSVQLQERLVHKLETKIETQASDKRLLRQGHTAKRDLKAAHGRYRRALERARRALRTVIGSGTRHDLKHYFHLRKEMESEKIAMSRNQMILDRVTEVTDRNANERLAKSVNNPKDPNPVIGLMVMQARAEAAGVADQHAAAVAYKAGQKLRKGKFAQAKIARAKGKTMHLKYLKVLKSVARFKVKAQKAMAIKALEADKEALRTLRNDKASLRMLRKKYANAAAVTRKADRALDKHKAKLLSAKKNLRIAKDSLGSAKARVNRLRRKRRRRVKRYNRAVRKYGKVKRGVGKEAAKLKFEHSTQRREARKKIDDLSWKVKKAKAAFKVLAANKDKWDRMKPKPKPKKEAPISERAFKKKAAEMTVKRLKKEQITETGKLKAKIEMLRKAAMGAAGVNAKGKKTTRDFEKEQRADERRAAKIKLSEKMEESRQKLKRAIRNLRAEMKRRLRRRSNKITAKYERKVKPLRTLLVDAVGDARETIRRKMARLKREFNENTSRLQARIKRRLKRRLHKTRKRMMQRAKQLAKRLKSENSKVLMKATLKRTLKLARKAMGKVNKVKKKIIRQVFGVLASKRRDIVAVTRNKIMKLREAQRLATDTLTKANFNDNIALVKKQADVKIFDLTKKYKDIADAKIARAAVKLLKSARGEAVKRQIRMRRWERKATKRDAGKARRQVERQFKLARKRKTKFAILRRQASSKLLQRLSQLQSKLKLKALEKIAAYEKISREKTNVESKEIIKKQDLVTKAATSRVTTHSPRKFKKQNNPWVGKTSAARRIATSLKSAEKRVASFKAKVMIAMRYQLRKKTRKLKARMADKLEHKQAEVDKSQAKKIQTAKMVQKKLRKAKRRLKRAYRKAAKSGKKVDRLKIARAKSADDSAKEAARGVLQAAKHRIARKKRGKERRKVQHVRKEGRKAVRRARRALRVAGISGSKVAARMARKKLVNARRATKKALEARINLIKQRGLREFARAMKAGGSPRGGGPVSTPAKNAVIKTTYLVRRAKESQRASDYRIAKASFNNAHRILFRVARHRMRKKLRSVARVVRHAKRRERRARKLFRSAQGRVEDAHAAIRKARRNYSRRSHLVQNDQKAAGMTHVLEEIAKANVRAAKRKVSRDKVHARGVRNKASAAAKAIQKASQDEFKAIRRYNSFKPKAKRALKKKALKKLAKQKAKLLKVKFKATQKKKRIQAKLAQKEHKDEKKIRKEDKKIRDLKRQSASAKPAQKAAIAKKLKGAEKKKSVEKAKLDATKTSGKAKLEKTFLSLEKSAAKIGAKAARAKEKMKQAKKAERNVTHAKSASQSGTEKKIVASAQAKSAKVAVKAKAAVAKKTAAALSKDKVVLDKARKDAIKAEKINAAKIAKMEKETAAQLKKLKLSLVKMAPPAQAKIKAKMSALTQKLRHAKQRAARRTRDTKKTKRKEVRKIKAKMASAKKKAHTADVKIKKREAKADHKAKKKAEQEVKKTKLDSKNSKGLRKGKRKIAAADKAKLHLKRADQLMKKIKKTNVEIVKSLSYHVKKRIAALKKKSKALKQRQLANKGKRKQRKQANRVKKKIANKSSAKISKKLARMKKDHRKKRKIARQLSKLAKSAKTKVPKKDPVLEIYSQPN